MKNTMLDWATGPRHSHLPLGIDIGLLMLRLWAGGVMALYYGVSKVGRLSADPIQFADPLGMGTTMSLYGAIFSELICGALLAFGLLTRAAIVPLIFTFLVIVFLVKWDAPFKEAAIAWSFLAIYISLICTGPGRFSLDNIFFSRR